MQNAINEILSRTTSKTANYTYAHATLGYSENVTTQTTIEDQLSKTIAFCDHVAYWVGDVLHLVDLITGGAVIAMPIEIIRDVNSKINTSIVSSLKAGFNYREHNSGDNSSAPTLTNETRYRTLSTGLDGGIEKDIGNKISAAVISGTDIIYDVTNLDLHLTRKKALELREPVTIIADGFLSYNIGDKVTYDTSYESGYLMIESIIYNEDDLQTTLYGRGQYIGKAP